MTILIPTITTFPDGPTRSDPSNFDTKAEAVMSALANVFSQEMQESIAAINTVSSELMSAVAVSEAYDSSKTGGYSTGDVVYSDESDNTAGKIYRAIQDQAEGSVESLTAITYWIEVNVNVGKQTIWVPAGVMISRTTSGAVPGTAETTTNKVMVQTIDFDATTQEYAQFSIGMPKSWNVGTFTAQVEWLHGATTTDFGVVWELQALAHSDGDLYEASWGTAVSMTDTGGITDTKYVTPESTSITASNSPASQDTVTFQLSRDTSDGGDTLAVDAKCRGLWIYYTTAHAEDS